MREELFKNCTLCPRKCNVNRLEGKRGYCGMDSTIRAARAALHTVSYTHLTLPTIA